MPLCRAALERWTIDVIYLTEIYCDQIGWDHDYDLIASNIKFFNTGVFISQLINSFDSSLFNRKSISLAASLKEKHQQDLTPSQQTAPPPPSQTAPTPTPTSTCTKPSTPTSSNSTTSNPPASEPPSPPPQTRPPTTFPRPPPTPTQPQPASPCSRTSSATSAPSSATSSSARPTTSRKPTSSARRARSSARRCRTCVWTGRRSWSRCAGSRGGGFRARRH